jgi:hypothetical protein
MINLNLKKKTVTQNLRDWTYEPNQRGSLFTFGF